MGTFTTNLKLGAKAFGVEGYENAHVIELTVGQLRIKETLPDYNRSSWDEPCYLEEAMCIETGVGSGTIWQYGKNIFANKSDAEAGVLKMHQKYRKQREAKQAIKAEQEARQRAKELLELNRLKEKYEANQEAA